MQHVSAAPVASPTVPSPHLFVERIMAAVNHAANVLSQAQGVKPDSNVEYSLNPSVLYSSLVRSPTVKDFPESGILRLCPPPTCLLKEIWQQSIMQQMFFHKLKVST